MIKFKDLPNTDTPITAENLNNNFEEASVAISATELTTKERVWFKKSNNLFNINGRYDKSSSSTTYEISGNSVIVTGKWFVGQSIEVKPNTNYTISANKLSVGYISIYSIDEHYITETTSSVTFNTENNSKIIVYLNTGGVGNVSQTATFTNVQLELGTTATKYEPYVKDEIYVKNSNGIFEQFFTTKTYKLTNMPSHSLPGASGGLAENNYSLWKIGDMVHLNISTIWLNSITKDTWVNIGNVPTELRPSISNSSICICVNAMTGAPANYGKIDILPEGVVRAKVNGTISSDTGCGIVGNIMWLI